MDEDTDDNTDEGQELDPSDIEAEDILPESVLQAFKDQAESAGSFREFAATLYDDNKKQRDKIRDLKSKVPSDDALVLEGEEAEAVRDALDDDTDVTDLPDVVQRKRELEAKEAKRERQKRRQQACEAAGVNAEAAAKLLPDDAELDVMDEDDEPRAVIRTEDGDVQPLTEHLESEYEPFTDVLFTEDDDGDSSGEGDGSAPSTDSEGTDESESPSLVPPTPSREGEGSSDDTTAGASYVTSRYAGGDDEG